jgi:hypothetical protein
LTKPKRILLVDNLLLRRENDTQQFTLQPHLGLVSLIAVLRNHGYKADLYDPKLDLANGNMEIDETLYSTIAKKIISLSPDVVGFTSLGCNFICTLKVARYLKKKEETFLSSLVDLMQQYCTRKFWSLFSNST